MMNAPQLRHVTPADDAFLRELEAAVSFVPMDYATAEDYILVLAGSEETPVGRLLMEHLPEAEHIVHLAVLPAFQKQGIGTCILREVQRQAKLRNRSITASIPCTKPVRKLFERHGFAAIGREETVMTMHWSAPLTALQTRDIAGRILSFLREIGLRIELADVPYASFLPGIELISGGMKVDLDRLLYPGDLLHEAGHLAALSPLGRMDASPMPGDGDEAFAMAWSYAAAVQLGLPVDVVFHDCGYRGNAPQLRENYSDGNYIGLPLLAWRGLTTVSRPANPSIYPQMLSWLRT